MSLSTEKAGQVGTTTINNMTLKPGNNTLPLAGTMDQKKVLSSLDSENMVELLIRGTDAIFNGEHLTYYVSSIPHLKKYRVIRISLTPPSGESTQRQRPQAQDERHASHSRQLLPRLVNTAIQRNEANPGVFFLMRAKKEGAKLIFT